MENKFENSIREKLQEREIQPSESAWERLSTQLDAQERKKKRSWFFYLGYAASILLIVSLFFYLNDKEDASAIPENTIVKENVKEMLPIDDKKFKKESIVPKESETVIAESTVEEKKNRVPLKEQKESKKIKSIKTEVAVQSPKVDLKPIDEKKINEIKKEEKTVVATRETLKTDTLPHRKSKSGIYVDSEALLYSVTHTRKEIKEYYTEYQISKQKVLDIISDELKKNKLTINPNTILAEVERDVNEESFQNNFYKFIKKRVSDVATAIANRNN